MHSTLNQANNLSNPSEKKDSIITLDEVTNYFQTTRKSNKKLLLKGQVNKKLSLEQEKICEIATQILKNLFPNKKSTHTNQLIHRAITIARLSHYVNKIYFNDSTKEEADKLHGAKKLIDLLINPQHLFCSSEHIIYFIYQAIGDMGKTPLRNKQDNLRTILSFALSEPTSDIQDKKQTVEPQMLEQVIYANIANLYEEGKFIPKNHDLSLQYDAYSKLETAELQTEKLTLEALKKIKNPVEDNEDDYDTFEDDEIDKLFNEAKKEISSIDETKEGDSKESNPSSPTFRIRKRDKVKNFISKNTNLFKQKNNLHEEKEKIKPKSTQEKKIGHVQGWIESALSIKLNETSISEYEQLFNKLKTATSRTRAGYILLCQAALSTLSKISVPHNDHYKLATLIKDIQDTILLHNTISIQNALHSVCDPDYFKIINERFNKSIHSENKLFCLLWKRLNSSDQHQEILHNRDHQLLAELCQHNPLLSTYFSSLKTNDAVDTKTLFSPQEGNHIIKLYSNAYDNEKKTSGTFVDICNDIDKSKNLIVITGWTLRLDWDMGMPDQKTLLERLIHAANRGVTICILVWEVSRFVDVHNKDLEDIHKKITTLAKELKVDNIEQHIFIKKATRELGLSDHAKIVIIDGEKMYAGGLDLTVDRENPYTWHDCHTAITGPIIKDALTLVEGRWLSTSSELHFPKPNLTNKTIENSVDKIATKAFQVVKTNYITYIKNHIVENEKKEIEEKELESKTSSSQAPTMQLLTSLQKKNWSTEGGREWKTHSNYTNEIARGYIQAIQSAERFIYIENQYFVGPRYDNQNKKTKYPEYNPVILAILEKIVERHKNGKPFHLYCQIPYIPDGNDPTKLVTSTQIRKTWKTVHWLAEEVQKKTGGHLDKYVTFYHLGHHDKDQKNGFIQKYTHSKLMIIDDNELIIGSANCNERSMAGNRDHEIVVRMRGQNEIKSYRHQLMTEHFGSQINQNPSYLNSPEHEESILFINTIMDKNLAYLKKNEDFDYAKIGCAVGYGLLPRPDFLAGKKPEHVLDRTRKSARMKEVSKLVR